MKNDIILTRKVDVSCWHVEGTFSIAKERSELMPVLIRAQENGGTNSTDIARHLLFDVSSRKMVAERLLNVTELYGLMERHEKGYILTEDGNKALKSKKVFVPEEGTWTIWMSEDSLLPNPVLSISSYSESSASTEILGKKSNEDERIFESLPHWVLDMSGSTEAQCIGGSEIRFDDFKKMAEPVDKYVNFNLIWNVSKSRLQLKGQLAGKDVSSDLTAPDIDLVDIWKQLLNSKPKSERHAQKEKINGWVPQRLRDQEEESSLFDDWDPGSRYLKVKFTAANDIERKTMCTDLTFESPDIYGLDRFDSLITTGIQIAPDSSRDAQDWAEWRLKESVSDYASYENFFAWWEQAKKPFVDYEIKTPERSKYAILEWYKNTEIPSHRAWYLIAAEDWRL